MNPAYQLTQVEAVAPAWPDPEFTDELTGLRNRAALTAESSRTGVDRSVLLIDLERFRAVNDTYGQACGDAVLRAMSARLQTCLEAGQPLFRLGDDEFAVVLACTDPVECEQIARDLRDSIRQPLDLSDSIRQPPDLRDSIRQPPDLARGELLIDAALGVALPHGELTLWELVSRAGAAVHHVKQSGRRPRVVVFDPEIHADVLERSALSLDLRGALARQELVLDYQPIVDMATRTPVGFEALARWIHPTRGLIGPTRFIPLVEDGGLMPEVGQWVLTQACRQAITWRDRTDQATYVSVNISVRQLEDPAFLQRVGLALADSGLDPRRLRLEVTESVLAAGIDLIVPRLEAVRAIGVKVLLDDFGTGYSSLGYVRDLPLDGVKLDRVFARDLTVSTSAWTMARSVVALLGQLHLEIIAEGLESAADLAQLRSLGCHIGQGFYFAKPGPPEALRFGRAGKAQG